MRLWGLAACRLISGASGSSPFSVCGAPVRPTPQRRASHTRPGAFAQADAPKLAPAQCRGACTCPQGGSSAAAASPCLLSMRSGVSRHLRRLPEQGPPTQGSLHPLPPVLMPVPSPACCVPLACHLAADRRVLIPCHTRSAASSVRPHGRCRRGAAASGRRAGGERGPLRRPHHRPGAPAAQRGGLHCRAGRLAAGVARGACTGAPTCCRKATHLPLRGLQLPHLRPSS